LPPIGLAVILAVGLTLAPSAVQAQQAKTQRIGYFPRSQPLLTGSAAKHFGKDSASSDMSKDGPL